jgi:hypothetical protein
MNSSVAVVRGVLRRSSQLCMSGIQLDMVLESVV